MNFRSVKLNMVVAYSCRHRLSRASNTALEEGANHVLTSWTSHWCGHSVPPRKFRRHFSRTLQLIIMGVLKKEIYTYFACIIASRFLQNLSTLKVSYYSCVSNAHH